MYKSELKQNFLLQVKNILDNAQLWALLNYLSHQLGSNICDLVVIKSVKRGLGRISLILKKKNQKQLCDEKSYLCFS